MEATKQHKRFWSLLKAQPAYSPELHNELKSALVRLYSDGKTESLSELQSRWPDRYERMIYNLKAGAIELPQQRRTYDPNAEVWRRRVIAVLCAWIDNNKLVVESKTQYAKSIACQAANCALFNRIPVSRLAEIYNFYLKRNKTFSAANNIDYDQLKKADDFASAVKKQLGFQ